MGGGERGGGGGGGESLEILFAEVNVGMPH